MADGNVGQGIGRALMLAGALGWVVFGFALIEGHGSATPAAAGGFAVSVVVFVGGWLLAGSPAPDPRLTDGETAISTFSGPLWRVVLTERRAVFTSTIGRRRSFAYVDIGSVTGDVHNPSWLGGFRVGVLIETRKDERRWIWVPHRSIEVADAINRSIRDSSPTAN